MLTKRQKLRKTAKRILNRVTAHGAQTVPVFIFGEMRSGTNMLARCFDQCLGTLVFHETDDEAFEDYVLRPLDEIERLIERASETHAIFKPIADSGRATEVLARFPGAKGIWIFRHYSDVINSAMRKWKEHNKYLHYVLHEPDTAKWRATNLPPELAAVIRQHYERGISEESARALIWYFRNQLYYHQALDKDASVLLVNYERLVSDAGAQLASAFDHVGLTFKQSYYGDVHSSSVGKDSAPEVDDEVRALCDELHDKLVATWTAGQEALRKSS